MPRCQDHHGSYQSASFLVATVSLSAFVPCVQVALEGIENVLRMGQSELAKGSTKASQYAEIVEEAGGLDAIEGKTIQFQPFFLCSVTDSRVFCSMQLCKSMTTRRSTRKLSK